MRRTLSTGHLITESHSLNESHLLNGIHLMYYKLCNEYHSMLQILMIPSNSLHNIYYQTLNPWRPLNMLHFLNGIHYAGVPIGFFPGTFPQKNTTQAPYDYIPKLFFPYFGTFFPPGTLSVYTIFHRFLPPRRCMTIYQNYFSQFLVLFSQVSTPPKYPKQNLVLGDENTYALFYPFR